MRQEKSGFWVRGGGRERGGKKNAHTKKFEKERNRGEKYKKHKKKTKPDLTRNIFRAI